MSASNTYVQSLVAHYLAQNYPAVLDPFLRATKLSAPDLSQPPRPDLRTLVSDYASSQLASQMVEMELDEDATPEKGSWKGWKIKDILNLHMDPTIKLNGVVQTLDDISAANLLTVQVKHVPSRAFNTSTAEYHSTYPLQIITTSVDKTIRFIDFHTGEVDRIIEPHKAAVLSLDLHPTNPRYLLTGSMDGTTVLTDLITREALQTFKSSKFVVRVAFSPDGRFIATASYDKNIIVYEAITQPHPDPPASIHSQGVSRDAEMMEDEDGMILDEHDDHRLACEPSLRYEERHRIRTETNPEAILFHPASTWLMYTVRSSHELFYVRLPHHTGSSGEDKAEAPQPVEKDWSVKTKSFNPHPMDNHVSFSILNLSLHPSGRVLACQTGDHRGAGGERILLYGVEPDERDRLECLWTGNDSDDFVLPRMAWLPDGTGFITTTPTGHLNLITMQGETRTTLKAHGGQTELGQATSEVVRDVAVVPDGEGSDWVAVSVGYDRKVRISR